MKQQSTFISIAIIAVTLLAACGKDEAPPAAAKADEPAAEETAPKLHVPDACSILEVDNVANVSGWKDLKLVPVDADPAYLSACNIVGSDPRHFVKIAIAVGGDEYPDSLSFAQIVGDRSGTLRSPAKPITNLGVPVVEMDGGPDMQAMQSRTKPYTELTITTPSMQLTRTLFPQALIALRKQVVKDS